MDRFPRKQPARRRRALRPLLRDPRRQVRRGLRPETAFFAALLDALSIEDIDSADQYDTEKWPAHHDILARAFRTRTRDEWDELLRGVDACATPVLTLAEAAEDEHARARGTYVDIDGIRQPGPAPRFSRTVSEARGAPSEQRASALETVRQWGLSEDEISRVL